MKSLAVLTMATLLPASFFQCCRSAPADAPSSQARTDQAAMSPNVPGS